MRPAASALGAFLASVVISLPAAASQLECYEAEGTMNTTCIQPSAVKANGDVRTSPIFMGGPKGVRATSFTLVTNCAKGISTLQDREGKNFAGGRTGDTPAITSLSQWVCKVSKPKKDASIRQF